MAIEAWCGRVYRASMSKTLLSLLLLPALLAEEPLPTPKTDAWRKVEQHFRFNNGAEPKTLDPHIMTGVPESNLAQALFEGLTTLHPKTLEPLPGLAERWEISPDRRTYVFHLRSGLCWSDGSALQAAAIAASWRRVLDRSTGSEYVNMLFPIAGAEAYHQAERQDDDAWAQVAIKVVSPVLMEVRLVHPCPYFLSLTAFHTLAPVPLDLVAALGERWTRPESIRTNGPFVIDEWLPRQRLVLTPNPRYWDKNGLRLSRITAYPYDDLETAYKLFKQGSLDWLSSVPLERIDELKRDPDYYAHPYLGLYYLRLNVTRPVLADVRVRRALALAIDREVITGHLLKAGQIPAGWFCPEGTAGYQAQARQSYDKTEARRLLAAAGYPEGQGFPVLELLFNTSEQHKRIAENVVEQWQRNLGISIRLRNAEWNVYLDRLSRLDYDIGRSGWIADYADPNTFFDIWRTGDGNNRTGWSNAAYDQLLTQAAAESQPARRLTLFQQMDRMLVNEAPAIPIYIYVNQGMLAERVGGFCPNLRDLHPFQHLWME